MAHELGAGKFAGYDAVPIATFLTPPVTCVLDESRPGRRAAITGASSGIGKGFAERLAAMGWNLTVIARDTARLDSLKSALEAAHGVGVTVITADLTRPDDIRRAGQALAGDPELDLFVNNAGVTMVQTLATSDVDELDAVIQLNSVAPVLLARYALPPMLERNRGAIINVSSAGAFVTPPFSAVYCSSKAVINSFTEALSMELQGTNLQLQALCPGMTATEMHVRAGFDTRWVASWMTVDQVVDASLAALRMGELICVPGLRDPELVREMRRHGAAIVEQTIDSVVADRYQRHASAAG